MRPFNFLSATRAVMINKMEAPFHDARGNEGDFK